MNSYRTVQRCFRRRGAVRYRVAAAGQGNVAPGHTGKGRVGVCSMTPLFILALVTPPAFGAFPSGYASCKVVTTQHTMVSGASDLANYPLAVILTDADLRATANGGLVNNTN